MKDKVLLLAVVVFVSMFSLFYALKTIPPIQAFQSSQLQNATYGSCELKAAIPLMGYLKCEIISHAKTSVEDFSSEGSIVKFGDNENGKIANTVSVTCDSPCNYVVYQVDPHFNPNAPCKIGSDDWCQYEVVPGEFRPLGFNAQPGEELKAYCQKRYFGLIGTEKCGGKVKWTYDAYGLVATEPTWGKETVSSTSCDLSAADQSKLPAETKGKTRLGWDEWVNYLVAWVSGPYELNIKKWGGKDVFCMGTGNIYEIGTFYARDGSCYAYPGKLIAFEDCCPGQKSANMVCGDDFKWHIQEIGTCTKDSDCPSGYKCYSGTCVKVVQCYSDMECPGSGQWVTDYSDPSRKTLVRYACQNNACVLVGKQVGECTPPDVGCPSGQVCIVDKETGKAHCEPQHGPSEYCGDGVCQPWESVASCPEDCKFPVPTGNLTWLWIPFFAVLGFLLGYRKKRDVIDGLTALLLGALIGFVIYYLLNLSPLQKLLLGLGIGVFGSIFIYLIIFTGFGTFLLILVDRLRR